MYVCIPSLLSKTEIFITPESSHQLLYYCVLIDYFSLVLEQEKISLRVNDVYFVSDCSPAESIMSTLQ